MWFWLTHKIHENLVIVLFIIILGLIFFPGATQNAAGAASSAVGPASELIIYLTKGSFEVVKGIMDAMFSQ